MGKFLLILSLMIGAINVFAQPLGEALSQRKKTFSEKMPKEVVELYEQNIKDLKASGLEKQALKVGDKVPEVDIKLGGEKYPLKNVYTTGPLVLKFYRGGWCPYCLTELAHYQKHFSEFKKAGSQVLAFSPDAPDQVEKTKKTHKYDFDILSDDDLALARKFGLVYKLDPKVVAQLKKDGIDLSVYQGHDKNELVIPGTFVINTEGRIVFAFVDADYRVRAEPEQVLKVVKTLPKKH